MLMGFCGSERRQAANPASVILGEPQQQAANPTLSS